MKEAGFGVFGGDRVEFEELVVVDFDEGFGNGTVFGKIEGFLKAELVIEIVGGGEVVNADGHMGYAGEGWGRSGGLGFGVRRDDEEGGEKNQEQRSHVWPAGMGGWRCCHRCSCLLAPEL